VKLRRAEDQTLRLLIGSTTSGDTLDLASQEPARPLEWVAYQWRPGADPDPRPLRDLTDSEGHVLLLELEGEDAILIAGAAVRRLPRGRDKEDLLRRAATGAAGWERERSRMWRWLKLPDQLQAFAERLNQADNVPAVCRALCEGIVDIVGAYDAVPLLRRDDSSPSFYSMEARLSATGGYHLTIPSHPRVWRPGIVTATEAHADVGSPFSNLSHLFADTGAAAVAHVPLGDAGVLLVVERRKERVFEPEDWSLLRSLASQAEGALRRVRSLDEVRTLSLTDPLTGLANRRRLQVVIEHAWAAALRGKPLAVALIDLDHFKQINDDHGHLAGDRLLQLISGVLQEEVRGTDLVVRYGGDEFLVLMPGESAKGAAALIGRVQTRLAGKVEFSAGIAEYGDEITSSQELIAEADRHLYQVKRQLRWHPD
jgi:diguanylate cyclase (GGDEF)-like protein